MCYVGSRGGICFAKYDDVLFAEFTPATSSVVLRKDSKDSQLISRRPTPSGDILQMVGELTFSLTKQIASKSEELRRLNNYVEDVQVLWISFLTCVVTARPN